MDAKTDYSDRAKAIKEIEEYAKRVEAGRKEAAAYKQNWQSVNINEVVDKFAPNSTPYINLNGKIVFVNDSQTIAVVADPAGGYLRIQDLTSKAKKGLYLTLDGKDGHNYVVNGKIRGRSPAEYEIATHFRIKKREEM